MPAKIGRDAAVALQRVDLVAPDRAVERIAMHEQDRGPVAPDLDGEAHAVHRESLGVAGRGARAHEARRTPPAPESAGPRG